MCGIAGFVKFDDNLSLAKLANKIQGNRGPDNQSLWSDSYISLAHQRLSIIDLSTNANQPIEKDGLVIVFNGEIYNYKELKQKLKEEKNIDFKTNSDTEVVLEMYRHYHVKCLDYFVGMFAFAIYNTTSKELFLARDHFGIKPLFYTSIGASFAFSSELKTLVTLPGFNKQINKKALVSCLNYLWVSGNDSMFEGTYKLPAAHYMIVQANGTKTIKRYWELKDTVNDLDETTLIQKLEKSLSDSVKRHMVADVPVSSFLSGGLDSSLISVIAKKYNPDLSTYTIITNDKDKMVEQMPEDAKYAKQIANEFNLINHEIRIDENIIKELPFIINALDEPIGDPAAIITYLMCKDAKQRGVKVLLSGMGADEIFAGYRRQSATLMAIKFNKLPSFVQKLINSAVQILPVKLFRRGFKFGRWSKRFMSFTGLSTHETYMRSYSYYDSAELKALLNKKYWDGIEAVYAEHASWFNGKYPNDVVNQMCYTDINMFMLGLNLTYTDRASMAASVEVRVPFIDKLLVEEAMAIKGSFKIKNGESKYILKKAAEKFLPKEIIYRPKASFGAPIRSWISNELKEMVNDLLSEENVTKRGLLNYDFVKKLIEDDRKGNKDNAYQIYQLITLELWCREYLDQ